MYCYMYTYMSLPYFNSFLSIQNPRIGEKQFLSQRKKDVDLLTPDGLLQRAKSDEDDKLKVLSVYSLKSKKNVEEHKSTKSNDQ